MICYQRWKNNLSYVAFLCSPRKSIYISVHSSQANKMKFLQLIWVSTGQSRVKCIKL